MVLLLERLLMNTAKIRLTINNGMKVPSVKTNVDLRLFRKERSLAALLGSKSLM